MHVNLVSVRVKREHIPEVIEATRANHFASVRKPGNLRFDMLQSDADSGRRILCEAYISIDDAMAHKQTAHHQKWRDAVAQWTIAPRVGASCRMLYPQMIESND
ncbi:MAG: antibiotic biosynthesis monooxygenase [Acidiferrobacterales bacterium]